MPKITMKCIDCGKESTPKFEAQFTKSSEKYRCVSCNNKLKIGTPSIKVTFECIDCGKTRTDYPSNFKNKGVYRCHECFLKMRKQNNNKISYFCVDCGKERVDHPSGFNKLKEEYRCRSCARKNIRRKNNKITMVCIDCGKERVDHPWRFNGLENKKDYRCRSCSNKIKSTKRIYKCKDCGKEKIYKPSYFNRTVGGEHEYRCKECLAKYRIENLKYDSIWKENHLIGLTGQGFWYGHPIINNRSYPQYCELWKDVNQRVHAFFDYECCLCGKKEDGKSHTGHHVFYVKEACCWFDEDGIYHTNLNAKDHKEKDYCIGENPNYFVILCSSCHGKTNGKFENRKKWANYFKDMIDTKYDGKCYLTKEEYEIYKNNNL